MSNEKITRNMTVSQVAHFYHQRVTENAMAGGHRNNTPLESLAFIASDVGEAIKVCQEPTSHLLGGKLAKIILEVLALSKRERIDIDYEIVSQLVSFLAEKLGEK